MTKAKSRLLRREEVPDGSVLALFSDVHVPHHDERALSLAVECCEAEGVTHVILNGDILDCGVSSRHAGKRARDVVNLGTLMESVQPGRWFLDWARTRPSYFLLGNHERWVEDKIGEDPALVGMTPMALLGLPEDGAGWEVHDSQSHLRLGSLLIEHGHGFFPSGSGGQNPASRIQKLAPDHTTIIGHLHRTFYGCWTTPDERGIPRTRAAIGNGHLSVPDSHLSYAGRSAHAWQQSFTVIRIWYDGPLPRFITHTIEIHRDKQNKPVFHFNGRTYR